MNDSLNLKYLTISPNDLLWGSAVNSVGFLEVGPGDSYPSGNHPSHYLFSEERGRVLNEYHLLYIVKGMGRFRSASLPHHIAVSKGSLMLLFPGEWHTYRPLEETGWKEYWIGFESSQMDEWVKDGFFSKTKPVWQTGLHSDMVELYEDAIRTATHQQTGFQQRLGGIVSHLLSLAWFYGKNTALSEVSDQMNRAKILIGENYRTIGPEEVAQKLCMGYSNFRRIFREYTGLSPAKYIKQVRMNKTKEALTNSNRSIKEIAFEMGYENEDYFFTAFRRFTGMTPSDYRASTQGKK